MNTRSNKSFIVKRAGAITCVVAFILIAIKTTAFMYSGSLSVLASLTDSLMDGMVSAMNFFALSYSLKPADKDHRYGHGKIEGLAAFFQSIFMFFAAIYLLIKVFNRTAHPKIIMDIEITLILMIVSIALSFIIIAVQIHAIKRSNSLALEADQAHYSADILQHGGVIIVLVTSLFGAPLWVDTLCGAIIAILILSAAYKIGIKAVNMVLDKEVANEERQKILSLIQDHPDVLGVHDLRATRSGMKEMILFDIEANPSLNLVEAHAITRDLEKAILKLYPAAEIMIHVDPHGEIEDSRHSVASVHYVSEVKRF